MSIAHITQDCCNVTIEVWVVCIGTIQVNESRAVLANFQIENKHVTITISLDILDFILKIIIEQSGHPSSITLKGTKVTV